MRANWNKGINENVSTWHIVSAFQRWVLSRSVSIARYSVWQCGAEFRPIHRNFSLGICMYVEADCLLRLAVVCRGFVVGKLWEDRVQRFWPGLWEHHSDGAWPGLSSIVNERVAKMMLNCSVCLSFCIIVPLKFHAFTSGKCKGKCDSALQRSNMCVFQIFSEQSKGIPSLVCWHFWPCFTRGWSHCAEGRTGHWDVRGDELGTWWCLPYIIKEQCWVEAAATRSDRLRVFRVSAFQIFSFLVKVCTAHIPMRLLCDSVASRTLPCLPMTSCWPFEPFLFNDHKIS